MFKFDFSEIHNAVVSVVDDAGKRVPLEILVVALKGKGINLGEEAETILRAIAAASTVVDLRAGRSGGIGRQEWYKGGSAPEPTGVVAKIAKAIREGFGDSLPKGDERATANDIANRYVAALASGECSAMPLSEVFAKFKD